MLGALAKDLEFSMDTPWRALPERARNAVLYGQDHEVQVKYKNRWGRERQYSTGFEGAITFLHRRHAETESDWSKEKYEAYMREVPCPVCDGTRLKPEVLAVLVGGRSIAEVCALPLRECRDFLDQLELGVRERAIATQVLKEIQDRLGFLLDVGLDYLSLMRPAGTLSGGEAQRIRLATQIGSGLVGVLYVLDEPASACTRETTVGSSTRSPGSATSGTRSSSSSTTRTPSGQPTGWSTSARVRASTVAAWFTLETMRGSSRLPSR